MANRTDTAPTDTATRAAEAASGAASAPLVLWERRGAIGVLTLNNPARRNVLSRAALGELLGLINQSASDQTLKCLVLRATGPAFSAGHDLAEIVSADAGQNTELFGLCTDVMEAIRLAPQVVIAQVHALATAAGCQLIATCDLVVAAEAASFATPGVKIGLFCTTPGVALARAVPTRKALEMLFTGVPITAAEALRIGLVNRVVPAGHLEEETMQLAAQIASASGHTLALGKRTFYQQIALDRPQAYQLAQNVMVENAQTPDAIEGMRAFLEKRPPKWKS